MRTRRGIRTPNLPGLSRAPLPVGLVGQSGVTRDRTAHGRLAKRSCAPAPTPWSHRTGSNRPPSPYEGDALPDELRRRGADGGSRTRSLPITSRPHGHPCYAGKAGSPGFEPGRAASEATMLPLHQLPWWGGPGDPGKPAGPPPFQHSQRTPSAAHDGTPGSVYSRIPASAGVRSPLRWLHGSHAATVFFHVSFPPRLRGRMWSTVLAGAGQ